jgi:glycosyltransferase involved in cell wall biosynthesis
MMLCTLQDGDEPMSTGRNPTAPLLPDVGILALVPDRWGGPWQVRHQLLTRLTSYFNVVWYNRPLEWRDYWLPGGKNTAAATPSKCGGMAIYDPGRWLPTFYRPAGVADYFERQRLHRAAGILRRRGCKHILLYVWRPEFGAALDMVEHDLSLYHMDDEYTFSPVEQEISETESTLIRRVDQVFIHSPALMAKKGSMNPHTELVTNGVDYEAFSTPLHEPEDMKLIPRPRIGYLGVLKDKLDFHLLSSLARQHRDWSFVFVGPKGHLGRCDGLVAELERMSNVHLLGGKPVEQLPAYAQHFDVSMLCYVVDGYTKFIYPLKINEYLATGKPVVGVPLPSIEPFGNVVRVASTVEQWSEAIAACLGTEEGEECKIAARQSIARRNDWNNQTYAVARAICSRMGEDFLRSLERARNHARP